jgi:hypothetical protein
VDDLPEPPSDAVAAVFQVIVPAVELVLRPTRSERRKPWPGSAPVERVRTSQIVPGSRMSQLPPVTVVASDVAASVIVARRPVPSPSAAMFSLIAVACPAFIVSRVTADAFERLTSSHAPHRP